MTERYENRESIGDQELIEALRNLRARTSERPPAALFDALAERSEEPGPALRLGLAAALGVASTWLGESRADRLFGPGLLRGAADVIERVADEMETK